MKPRAYELTPFRLVLPGVPIPACTALPEAAPIELTASRWPAEVPIVGLHTVPTSCERAQQQANELLERARRRLRGGDRFALVELLDDNPEFIAVSWVREELGRLVDGGLSLRKPGRPRGRYRVSPLMVAGVVEHLVATKKATNPEQAFGKLEALGVLSYEFAKEAFYRARRESRCAPVLMMFPELSRLISREAGEEILARTVMLHEHGKVSYMGHDPALGSIELTVSEC